MARRGVLAQVQAGESVVRPANVVGAWHHRHAGVRNLHANL